VVIDGSGKTWSGSLLGIILALKYPGIRGLVGAYTFTLVRDTTLQTYFEHLDALGIEYTYSKSEFNITFSNGSVIMFRHFDEPNALKSLNVGFIEIEEMSDVPESTFRMLISRLRQYGTNKMPEGFVYRLFGHTNPQPDRGWIYENFKVNPIKNSRRIIAPTTDNKYLPKDYLSLLRDVYKDDDYFNLYVLGQDSNYFGNLVTKNFDKDQQIKSNLQINPKFPIHVTCDFNVDPMCWYICQHYDNNVYVLREYVNQNTTTELSANLLCDNLEEYKDHEIIINGDASGNSNTTRGTDYVILMNCFKLKGFRDVKLRVMNKNPGIEWRISCWNAMISGPDKQHHIFIDDTCTWLLYNIDNLEIEPGKGVPKNISTSKIKIDPKAKYLIHPIDAVSYLVCLYYPIKNMSYSKLKAPEQDNLFNGKYDPRLAI
jgi:PBSX family phage terminase large subunit